MLGNESAIVADGVSSNFKVVSSFLSPYSLIEHLYRYDLNEKRDCQRKCNYFVRIITFTQLH